MLNLKFALPKGHLENETFQILERAGYVIRGGSRSYRPEINDPEIELKILRPQEIPMFVGDGSHDIGITGLDWLRENRSEVETLLNLEYSYVRIILAVPISCTNVNSLSDLLQEFYKKGDILRISTEYLNLTAEYLKDHPVYRRLYDASDPIIVTPWLKKGNNQKVVIYLSFGATEAKPPENADAIVEVVETGTSLERNDLKVVETIMCSNAVLIANKKALEDHRKREKIYDVLTLIRGVLDGRKKLHIFLNVTTENLPKLMANLPALKSPTISPLSEEGWFSVNTVIDKKRFLEIIPVVRQLAQGLVVYEPRQVLPLKEIRSEVNEN